MKKLATLQDLLVEELRDLHNAESQIIKALPKMVKNASSEKLKTALQHHLDETEDQVDRLEQALEILGASTKGRKCQAMTGILDEGKEIMTENASESVCDAAIISAAQKVEHYEIASYGCVCTWSDLLGLDRVSELLKETLAEEKKADETLTEIAESEINVEALTGDTA